MVTGIFIPWHEDSDIVEQPFEDGRDFQVAVYGYVEVVHMSSPKLNVYVNAEGKVRDSPLNVRATSLWWLFSPEARGRDVMLGDVVVVGALNGRHSTTAVPEAFRTLLLETPLYSLELRRNGGQLGWLRNETDFPTFFDAARYGIGLLDQSSDITAVRVVSA